MQCRQEKYLCNSTLKRGEGRGRDCSSHPTSPTQKGSPEEIAPSVVPSRRPWPYHLLNEMFIVIVILLFSGSEDGFCKRDCSGYCRRRKCSIRRSSRRILRNSGKSSTVENSTHSRLSRHCAPGWSILHF